MKKDFKRALSKILAGAMLITSSFSSVVSVTAAENDSTGDTVAFQNDLKSITVPSTTTPTSIDGATISLVAQNETDSAKLPLKVDSNKGLVFGGNDKDSTGKLPIGTATIALGKEVEAGWMVDVVIHASQVTNATVFELQDKDGNKILSLNQGGKWNTYKPTSTSDTAGNTALVTDNTKGGQATWRLNLGGDTNTINTTRFLSKKTTDGNLDVWSDNTGASSSQGTTNFRFVFKKDKTLQIFSGPNFETELGVTITTNEGKGSFGNALTADDFKNTSTSIGKVCLVMSNSKQQPVGFSDLKITKLADDKEDPDEPTTSGGAITTEKETLTTEKETSSQSSSEDQTQSSSEAQTQSSSEDQTQSSSEAQTQSSSEDQTQSSSEASSESSSEDQKYDMGEAADAEKVADDAEAAASTTSKKFLITGDGVVTKNESGSVTLTGPASGSSKLVAKFPKVYTDGTVTFETKVNLGEFFATANQGIVELWGTGGASGKDVLAVRVADGKYQFSVLGTKHGVADFAAGEVDVKIVVNLKDKTAECYINGKKVADENGPVTLADSTIAAITEISHAAYFSKNGSATEILSMAVGHEGEEQPPVDPVTGSGLKSTVAPVGEGVDLNNLKAGDKIAVTYSLDDKIAGINNYTMFINFNPNILTFDSAEKPADPFTGFVTYDTTTALGVLPLVPGDLIEAQAKVKTGASNPDYAGTIVPATADTTAAEVGRIKLAAVAGLNGASTNKEDSANVATTAGGKLFTVYFTVKEGTKGGSTTVSLDPVAGSKANELFFQKPVDGQGSSPVDIGTEAAVEGAVTENVIEVPVKIDAFEYSYEGDGVKIAIDAEGKVTVEGDNVEGLDGETLTITLKKDTIAPADFIAHMVAATAPEGVTVTDASEGDVKKVTIAKGDKSVTFIIEESEKGGEIDPPVGGSATVKITGAYDLAIEVEGAGLKVTSAKGKSMTTENGAIASIVGTDALITNSKALTTADFTITGGTGEYDSATSTLKLTIGGVTYDLVLFVYGDYNNNGSLDVNDAGEIVSRLNSGEVNNDDQRRQLAGNVNINEIVDVNDAGEIVNILGGTSTIFSGLK